MNHKIIKPAIDEFENWFLESEKILLENSSGLSIIPEINPDKEH